MQIADRGANHFVGMLGILRIVDRIAHRDQGRTGIVGDENGGEVLIQRSGPVQRPVYGGPTADLFDRQTFDVVVELIVDEGGGIRSGSVLVAEAGRPGGQSCNRATFVRHRGLELQHIGVIEVESLTHGQIPVGVFERDVRGGGLRAFVQREIQHRVQLAAQGFIVGPQ